MAVIDESRNVLVIRVVYDGPALSGKTTSLKTLARGVSSQVESPAEMAGRTLFFDWVDYVGGLFDGRQIRCQIVSVPGQRELAHRRKLLLESADAVVLVLDTRKDEWEFGLDWLKETAPYCRSQDPPVGLVLQANKRDASDAVPLELLRSSVRQVAPVAIVSSTATSGDGIRETFVLAVRLALDRVRALAAAGRLRTGKPSEDTSSELLARMSELDDAPRAPAEDVSLSGSVAAALASELDPPPPATESLRPSAPQAEGAQAVEERVFVPDPQMPGGMIWPPVDGRTLLHEVASLDIKPIRTGRTDWAGSGSGFRFHSFSGAIYADVSSARHELLEWARLHSANLSHLSSGRAVILADAGSGRLRLWQIVRSEATLRERLAAALPLADPVQVAREVWAVAAQLIVAREFFESTTIPLPCTLWTIGATATSRPPFVGLMPLRSSNAVPEPTGRDLMHRELSPQLRHLRRARVDYSEIVRNVTALAETAAERTPARWLAEIVHET
jgi:signal recognition particle receptor subunit beta